MVVNKLLTQYNLYETVFVYTKRGFEMKLELFKFDSCPYCQRVMKYIKDNDRTDIIYRDIRRDPQALEILVTVGGMEQVPCLFINGEPLYESLDIIDWLKAHPQE